MLKGTGLDRKKTESGCHTGFMMCWETEVSLETCYSLVGVTYVKGVDTNQNFRNHDRTISLLPLNSSTQSINA